MANGDAALLAGMEILTGNEDRRDGWDEINMTRDYLAERTDPPGTPRPIAKGGTGASTPEAARSNLGFPDISPPAEAMPNAIAVFGEGKHLQVQDPWHPSHAATKAYVDAKVGSGAIGPGGGTITGTLYMPNLTAVTSGYIAMYRNSDGRIGIGPSAARFKKDIRPHPYTLAQLRAIRVVNYRLRAAVFGSADAPVDVGVIAEDLIDAGLEEFVGFDEHGAPLSVHYERLALVAIGALQELANTVDDLDRRLAALEA